MRISVPTAIRAGPASGSCLVSARADPPSAGAIGRIDMHSKEVAARRVGNAPMLSPCKLMERAGALPTRSALAVQPRGQIAHADRAITIAVPGDLPTLR